MGKGGPTVMGLLQQAWRVGQVCMLAGVDFLLPPACVCCLRELEGETRLSICQGCTRQLLGTRRPTCRRCGVMLPRMGVEPIHARGPQGACPACRRSKFLFDTVLPPLGPYRGELRQVLLRMKHAYERPLLWGMGQLWSQQLRAVSADWPDCLVPVPRHWWRRWQTQQDVARQLAECLSEHGAGGPLRPLLQMRRWVSKQSLLSRQLRQNNLAQAMRVRPGVSLKGCHVGLVDDIMTTGATLNEAARALRAAGATRISILVVARALPEPNVGLTTPPDRA